MMLKKSDHKLQIAGALFNPQNLALAIFVLWARVAPMVSPVLLIGFMFAIGGFAVLQPTYGWDALPYLAAALQHIMGSADLAHTEVYHLFREGLSSSAFAALSEGDTYRARQYTDPVAFQSMLGMYEVKWLYIRLLMGAMQFVAPLKAIIIINLAALILLTFSIGAWMSRHKLWVDMPLVIALLMICRVPELARTSTPDLLSVALVASALLMFDRGRHWGACLVFAVATLARPDMVVLPLVLWAGLGVVRDPRFGVMTLAAFGSFAAYWFTTHTATGHPGWWAHLWFSTYQMQDTMIGFQPEFSLRVYLIAFAYNLARSVTENIWFGLWIAAMIGWLAMLANNYGRTGGRDVIVGACLAAIAAKFVVFPLHDARTYLPILMPAILLMGASLTPYIRKTSKIPV